MKPLYNLLTAAIAMAIVWYTNPPQWVLMTAIVIITLALLAYGAYKHADKLKALRQQHEESAEEIQSRRRMYMEWHNSFKAGAVLMSGLTILMTMIGAFGLYSWIWAALAFCLGSIGASILRHYSTPAFVGTTRDFFALPTVGGGLMMVLLFIIFFGNTAFLAITSIKPMLDDEGQRRNERILNADELARQKQKVDAAWSQVELYDQYKDPAGIAAEQNANAKTQRQASDAIAKLNSNLDRINAEISAIVADNALYMTHNYDGKTDTCTPRNNKGAPYTTRANAACAQISPLRSQYRNVLAQVSSASTATSTSYESGHHTYKSKYATWQQESDKLSSMKNGEGVIGADRAFERALSQLFKTTAEEALWLFIILVGLFFDAMTIFALLATQYFRERCTEEFAQREAKQRAKKRFARLVDAGLDEASAAAVIGGNITSAPAKPRQEEPQQPERGFGFITAESVSAAKQSRQTGGLDVSYGVPNLSAPYAFQVLSGLNLTPVNLSAPDASAVIYRDRQRVPPELSGKAGKGRVGKLDTCIDCGADYEVLAHNGLRCKPCSENNATSYRLSQVKAKA
jgi:hypothetical protein